MYERGVKVEGWVSYEEGDLEDIEGLNENKLGLLRSM